MSEFYGEWSGDEEDKQVSKVTKIKIKNVNNNNNTKTNK